MQAQTTLLSQSQVYEHLTPYTYPQNYVGESYYGTYTIYGIHRESSLLEQSNFYVLYARLSEMITNMNLDENLLQITRANHFAFGWVDTLRLSMQAPDFLLILADSLLGAIEQYPILSEDDYSQRQDAAIREYWQSLPDDFRRDLCRQSHVDARRIAKDDMPNEVYDHLWDSVEFS